MMFLGGRSDERKGTVGGDLRSQKLALSATAANRQIAATAQAIVCDIVCDCFGWTSAGAAVAGAPPSAIQRSCSLTSCAVWKRSSGSFCRQVVKTCSNAGGVEGLSVLTGSGSFSRIADASEI